MTRDDLIAMLGLLLFASPLLAAWVWFFAKQFSDQAKDHAARRADMARRRKALEERRKKL